MSDLSVQETNMTTDPAEFQFLKTLSKKNSKTGKIRILSIPKINIITQRWGNWI